MTEKRAKAEIDAEREQARHSAAWLRKLAERGLAELPPSARNVRERAGSNSAWLRELAVSAQAELDLREQREA